MSYAAAITRLGQKLRDSEAWPSDSSKQAEQLHLLYNAAIAVLRHVPAHRLHPTVLSAGLTDSGGGTGFAVEFELPADIFFYRDDHGIQKLRLDNIIHFPRQAIPKESLMELAGNSVHAGRVLFAIDSGSRTLLALNTDIARIRYFPTPAYPAATSDTFPIADKGNDYEMALSIVAAHVSGETIRDGGASTFQTFLTQLYDQDNERD